MMSASDTTTDSVAPIQDTESAAWLEKTGAATLLARLSRWLERDQLPSNAEVQALYSAKLTDVAANKHATQWGARYLEAAGPERCSLLAGLVQAGIGIEPRGDQGLRLFRRLYAQADSLRLLVELRADMLRWRNQVAGLTVLERELGQLLSNWFDVGMLELRPINWDSPASLLEKLIQYEAVHEISSWEDLRRRVAADRRCYAFFHPRMSNEPLIFVEVAFAQQMANNVQAVLDPAQPAHDPAKARWAMFYSISNTQPGLRGISFGNFLLKRVIDELLREWPRLKYFATLSPIPRFADWLGKQDGAAIQPFLVDKNDKRAAQDDPAAGAKWVERLRKATVGSDPDPDAVRRSGLRLAAHYLKSMKDGHPLDPVARFHLGNGARIERVNWAADTSTKGLTQSCGMMVNYVYELAQLDSNLVQLAAGNPRTARAIQWL
jgi:malonyl-CoA decarboxylase